MIRYFFNSILLLFITFSLSHPLQAQNAILSKVPKQYSLEMCYRYTLPVVDYSNVLTGNSTTNGYGFLFDYGWQLSGLNGDKPAVYLTVPIGYAILLADDNNSVRTSMLNYGWTVRHELNVNKKLTPFVGYGLLLNTLKLSGTEGSVMGHQTQFEFGANLNTFSRLRYFAKVQYSYTSYPKLGDSKRIHFQFIDLCTGVRF